jgi:hypothetical protein
MLTWRSLHPQPQRSQRARWWALLGLATAIGLAAPHGRADAAIACRSDPVLVVNGAVVDVVSTLYTTSDTVKELDYVITVPAGSVINKTTLTVGLGFPEKVSYVFSRAQPWGTMSVAATVQTQAGVAPFQTSVQASPDTLLLTGASTASGMSNATVMVSLSHLVML